MAGAVDGPRGRSPALVAAGLIATLVVAAAFALRLTVETPVTPSLPQRLMPVLVALATVCIVGLLLDRAPRVAWLAAATAAGIAAVEVLAVCRALLANAEPGMQPLIAAGGAAAGLSAAAIAIAYAARSRTGDAAVRIGPWVAMTAAGAAIVGVGVAAWAVSTTMTGPLLALETSGDAPVRIMARVLLAIVALGLLVGLVRDAGGAALRARERVRTGGPGGTAGAQSPFLGAFADELFPVRLHERRHAAEAERARLAADLHAIVLPELRDAAAAAERGADPAAVAAGVRRSLEGLERLMHERQSVVLEQFGLVAALEWLAERTEERTDLVVELELEGERVAERDAMPPDVARVAFRVALLALDNVVRHADAQRATVRLVASSTAFRLSVVDDGGRAWLPDGAGAGRGLSDMRRAAAEIGAALDVVANAPGTAVLLSWSVPAAAGNPATSGVETAARPDAFGG